jgi:hypothetical protein
MARSSSDTFLIIAIVILSLTLLIGIILAFVFNKEAKDCQNNESPYCLTGNCPAASSACDNMPFKIVGGQTLCKGSILSNPKVPLVQL